MTPPIGVRFPSGDESVNNPCKSELIHQQGLSRAIEQADLATFEYVWGSGNQRLHGEIDLRTPAKVEPAYYADLESGQPDLAGPGCP